MESVGQISHKFYLAHTSVCIWHLTAKPLSSKHIMFFRRTPLLSMKGLFALNVVDKHVSLFRLLSVFYTSIHFYQSSQIYLPISNNFNHINPIDHIFLIQKRQRHRSFYFYAFNSFRHTFEQKSWYGGNNTISFCSGGRLKGLPNYTLYKYSEWCAKSFSVFGQILVLAHAVPSKLH